ncbi:MAG: AAA family ATPase [Candidatus Hydrogenedentes bacterium]|nr:AAA family ATPase [Candidatus Hydrogenedentota bacterium]
MLREVFHRNIRLKQIQRLANCLAPVLAGAFPPNVLIYGPSGTGKSVTCLHFLSTLTTMCEKKEMPFSYFYLDLTTPKTCFGALNELAIAVDGSVRRYRKGIALEHIQETIITALGRMNGFACVLIDEVDNVTCDADIFLTFLVKTLPKKVQVGLFYVFLTNRLAWEKNLDPRILSVLKKQDLIFEPYDALDLVEILRLRVEKALDPAKVEPAAIHKIAAYASRETGDARKAVELLAKAVKVAEESSGRLSEVEVDAAEHSLEIDKTQQLINALAVQQRLALKACYAGLTREKRRLSTGSAFDWYQRVCQREGVRPLTQRRFSDMISFLDLYGLVNARVISKGRYGKTREVSAALSPSVVNGFLEADDGGLQ